MKKLAAICALRRVIRWGCSLLVPAFVILLIATAARAQVSGSFEGTIIDPNGDPVPGATVTLINTDTGQQRQTLTNSHGFYEIAQLGPGAYDLRVSLKKANKYHLRDFELLNLPLEVGQIERVNGTLRGSSPLVVSESPPLVSTESATIGDEIDNRRVTELPLNGRQFTQLALLAAGAVPPYPNGATQQFNTAAQGLGFSVGGQRSERNNFTLDGISVVEPFAYSLTVNPSVDAIREFRVAQDSYPAEQGMVSGAQVNIATRSGTNRLAGTVYEFLRNSAFDARNFFDDPARPIPPFRQNQFGASLGGPLRPNRTFFFGNYEGFRVRQSVTNTTLLPPAALRSGDFGGIDPITGRSFPAIVDPATGKAFAGNVIPAARIDPLSAALLARVPLPNQAGAPVGANNSINVGRHDLTSDQFTARLDHQLTTGEQVFGRVLYFNSTQLFPFVPNTFAQNPPAPPGFGTDHDDKGFNLALGLTSVPGPSVVNDFRFGYIYYLGNKASQNIQSGFLKDLGISRAPGATNDGIPAIDIPGYADLGDSDIFQPQVRKDNTFQFTDNLAWVRGRHVLKLGADYRRLRLYYLVEDFGQGVFEFSDGPGSVSGSAFADFLLGRPFLSFAQAGNSGGNDRVNYFGAYVSDEYHATSRLTLNYGLREEFYSPPVNADGRGSILDPSDPRRFIVRNDRGQAAGMVANPLVETLGQSYGLSFMTSQQAGLPASLIRPDWSNWAPRLGFAYDVSGRGTTSVRGGIGIYNSLAELDYAAETRLSAPIAEFLFGLDLCRFYGPGACGQAYAPPPLSYGLAYQLGNQEPVAISTPPNIRNGYVYEWSLTVDHALSPHTLVSLSYTGSEGRKLPRRSLQNQGVPNLPGERRGYHPMPGSNQFVRATDVNSNYNALVARLERRFAKGLAFEAGYTFGKSIDTASGLQGTDQPQDVYNLKAERGLSDFDMRQRFVTSAIWDLPFGPNRAFVRDGIASKLVGNWQLGAIMTLESGQPLTAVLGTALSGTQSNGTDRPDLVGAPNLPAGQRDPSRWFNTAAFVPPPLYYDAMGAFSIPGNEGRNVITGPALAGCDLSLSRNIRFSERAHGTLRADVFNLTNHPNFDRPGLIVGTSNFGRVASAENSRQIQLSLRIEW
jgi:hypothetical protein